MTLDSRVVWPASRIIAREVKHHAWDERGTGARFAELGMLAGIVTFAGQGAGIAALGTAIGVPLWFVFGASAGFVGILYEEVSRRRTPDVNSPDRAE